MIKIYHNPRCRKSREGLAFLESKNIDFQIITYLDTPLEITELQEIIELLGISPIELVRKNESIWKEKFKGKELSDHSIIEAMVSHPKLIERPIVVNGNKAVIGRPIENIASIL